VNIVFALRVIPARYSVICLTVLSDVVLIKPQFSPKIVKSLKQEWLLKSVQTYRCCAERLRERITPVHGPRKGVQSPPGF